MKENYAKEKERSMIKVAGKWIFSKWCLGFYIVVSGYVIDIVILCTNLKIGIVLNKITLRKKIKIIPLLFI